MTEISAKNDRDMNVVDFVCGTFNGLRYNRGFAIPKFAIPEVKCNVPYGLYAGTWRFRRYNRGFVITEVVIIEFDCTFPFVPPVNKTRTSSKDKYPSQKSVPIYFIPVDSQF
jgi:hypothetical protein